MPVTYTPDTNACAWNVHACTKRNAVWYIYLLCLLPLTFSASAGSLYSRVRSGRVTGGLSSSQEKASGAVVARPTPMQKVRGSRPFRDKDFRVRMRRPNYLGLVTITSFGWDNKPRSSVCTHSEHQARTIKILQSLCVSHKIVETYRNQHAQCILSDPCQ
jgi:hypothetical protein